ncbi:hypothetical protein ABZX85_01410 [Streptomyces sp. NPDC004539]|uniref:hypothetical protein n=1 Tax=Streptomyces sp. NPDC004539 TaxID=3154280 RepID=UPI0033A431C2
MSDDVLSVIPDDPRWQPSKDAAARAHALVASWFPENPEGFEPYVETTWYDAVNAVDCGENLDRIGCPVCGGEIDLQWWCDLGEAHAESGFTDLGVTVPCCGAALSLDTLRFEAPCGFSRFEIAVWNPERDAFGGGELAALADALGHPVRQIRAHI